MNRDLILSFLSKAILAPSGDNMQPWRFDVKDNRLDIYVVCEHKEHFFESGYRSLYFSAGAVLENIRVAANHAGFDIKTTYLPDKKRPEYAASVEFEKSENCESKYFDALETRCTNRKFYKRGKKVDSEIYLHLNELLNEFEGFNLLWTKRDRPAYKNLARVIGEADQLRFENEKIHGEFVETLRFGKKNVEETCDGLDVRSLESGPGAEKVFRFLSSWKNLKSLNTVGLSKLFNLYAQMQMNSSQACGLIAAEDYSPLSFIRGGELMQRIWHDFTLRGLSLQPMESLPIFMMNISLGNASVFYPGQKEKVDSLGKNLAEIFGTKPDSGVIFLFRMGYADPPSARSKRKQLSAFLTGQPAYQDSEAAA